MAAIVLSVGCANMHAPELSIPPKGYEYSIDLAAAEAAGYRWEERDGRIIRVSTSGRGNEWPADKWMEEAGYSWSQEDSYMVCFSPEETAATFAAIFHPDESGWFDRKDYTLCHLSLFPLTVSVRGLHGWHRGGAHPHYSFLSFNRWWRDNHWVEIRLEDFFNPLNDWRALLAPIVRRQLAKEKMAGRIQRPHHHTLEGYLEDAKSGLFKVSDEDLLGGLFTFSESGIVFQYDRYVVDTFGFELLVPIEEIDHILSTDGPMARWLH